MTDAGGTNTLIQLSNEGPYMKYIIHNSSVTDGETIPIDGVSNAVVSAGDKVIILGALDHSGENQLGDGELTIEYGETAMHFTVTLSGLSDTAVSIVFMLIPQTDVTLGD